MGNYGIRISQTGKDVKTCLDRECAITSKYSNLKGSLSGSGTVTLNPPATITVTIPHNLGYIPFGRVFQDYGGFAWLKTPYVDGNANFSIQIIPRFDSTNFYIDFTYDSIFGSATVNYKYFIFIDKGKL